jgi:peptide/nickel transport system substrate-binding protein
MMRIQLNQPRTLYVIVWFLMVAVYLTLTAGGGSAVQGRTHPDRLRYALPGGDVHSLDPVLEGSTYEDEVDALFSDLLVGIDDHGRPFGELAARVPTLANGDITRDGRSITYHLRRGVRWHDGASFTSRDVRFSWEAMMNPRNDVQSRAGYDIVRRVLTPDPFTAVFVLKRPFAPAVMTIFGGGSTARIIPAHLLANYPDLNHVDFNQHPIGTGPFKVVAWNRGRSIELERNDDYFLGKPRLSHLSVLIVPSYETAGIMLKGHDLDVSLLDSATYRLLRDARDLRLKLVPIDGFDSLTLNVTSPNLLDLRVRRAIAYALDRESLVRKNTVGAIEADSDIVPLSWAHARDVATYAYDPAKAAALLESAGWQRGPGGVRMKAGKTLTLDLVEEATSTSDRNISVQIQSMLHDVGIDVRVLPYASSTLWAPAAEGGVASGGKFDALLSGSGVTPDPDNSTLFMCRYDAPNGQNLSRYCNRVVDRLEEKALATVDPEKRKRYYAAIEHIVSDELPVIPLFWSRSKFGISPDVRGFNPNGVTPTWNAGSWSI